MTEARFKIQAQRVVKCILIGSMDLRIQKEKGTTNINNRIKKELNLSNRNKLYKYLEQ